MDVARDKGGGEESDRPALHPNDLCQFEFRFVLSHQDIFNWPRCSRIEIFFTHLMYVLDMQRTLNRFLRWLVGANRPHDALLEEYLGKNRKALERKRESSFEQAALSVLGQLPH